LKQQKREKEENNWGNVKESFSPSPLSLLLYFYVKPYEKVLLRNGKWGRDRKLGMELENSGEKEDD